ECAPAPPCWIKPMSGVFVPKDAGFLGPKYGALALGDGRPPENLLRPAALSPDEDNHREEHPNPPPRRHARPPPPAMPADEDNQRNDLRTLADRRYAGRRRTENVEAMKHVFDMAAQLQQ